MMTKRSPITSVFTAGLAAALALGGLTACNQNHETDQTNGGGGQSSDQTPPGQEPNETEPNETEGEEPGAEEPEHASGAECLVGTWLADNTQLGELFKSAAAAAGAAGSVSEPTGQVLVTFGPDGQFDVDYQDWTMKLSQDGMAIELIREGTDTGSYQATDDGSVSWTETTMGSVATMKTPAGSYEVTGEASSTSGTYDCELDTLTITAEGGTTALNRQ